MTHPPPLPLEDAQARLITIAPVLPTVEIDVTQTLGRYLVEPLLARRTQPAAAMSAMDGYAVAGSDIAGPWRVAGESAAGHPYPNHVDPGEAIRVSTGAVMPDGTDTVILQEDVVRHGETVALTKGGEALQGRHVRAKGSDFVDGTQLAPTGTKITPALIALALAAGHSRLAVRRKVRLAICDSGDELARPGERSLPHQVPASNAAMLAAMVAALPCEVSLPGPVPDQLDAIAAMLDNAENCDVIVTSGGASVGDHDLIRPALEDRGASIDFWRVAIKPGKPLLVATRRTSGRDQIVVGLPGNPVSSHVTAFLFLLPLLRAMLGAAAPLPRKIRATLGAALGAGGARREFIRARWDGETVVPAPQQDSGALWPLAASNVLVDRPAGSPSASAGDLVTCYLLENGGIA